MKKAELVVPFIMQAFVGAVVLLALVFLAQQISSGGFQKTAWHTNNVGEFVNTLAASPYSLVLGYPYEIEKKIEVRKDKFTLGDLRLARTYPLVSFGSSTKDVEFKGAERLWIRNEPLIEVSDKYVPMRGQRCVDLDKIEGQLIVISEKPFEFLRDGLVAKFGASIIYQEGSELLESTGYQILIKIGDETSIRYGDGFESVACTLRSGLKSDAYLLPSNTKRSVVLEVPSSFDGKILEKALIETIYRVLV